MANENHIFANRYQIVRHIARGGMAQVYLARDLLLDRPVALKVLFPELSVDLAFVERFRREAQAAANLSHPNIVSIYDWGQGDSTYSIVMEYVDGETLSARIRREPVPADEAAVIAIATASALSFAHRHNVIHRDVKPGNVLIDKSGHVKVADFGIARAVGASESLTQAGAVMGTASYFSPEQAQGHPVDARSDVYSLGVVLYEMAVGKPPFQGDNPVAIAYQHVREAPPPPRSIKAAIPRAYEAIVLKAMAKDPADRYQTADALRIDLERFRAGQRVAAGAAGPGDATAVLGGAAATRAGGADATTAMAGATSVLGTAAATATGVNRPAGASPSGRRPMPPVGPPGYNPGDDTGPFDGEGRSRTGLYVALLVLLVAALVVLGYFIGKDFGLFGGARTLTVPNVADQPAATAKAALSSKGFTDISDHSVRSPTIKAGDVVGTNPAAGSREKSSSPIVIDVSAGPTPIQVPPVDGETQALAVATLKQDGFLTTVSRQTSNTVAEGNVIRTDPPGDNFVYPGIRVEVVVSSGRQQVPIPSLTYDNPAQAGATLSLLGFSIGQAPLEASVTVPAGEVTRTSPGAGAVAPYGSKVTIYVSSGQPLVTIPPLIGKTQDQAASTLATLGLEPSFTTVTVATASQNGRVQSLSPPAGSSVAKGATVTVVIGSYSAPTTTSSSSSTSTSTSTSTSSTTTTTTPTTSPSTTGTGGLVGNGGFVGTVGSGPGPAGLSGSPPGTVPTG